MAAQKEEKKTTQLSLEKSNLHNKVGVAFFMASLVPILLMWYCVQFYLPQFAPPEMLLSFQCLLFFALAASVIGFWIHRKIASALASLVHETRAVLEGGTAGKTIKAHDQAREIEALAKTFNKIVQELEEKVRDLQDSKQLVHNLLHRIGTATTEPGNFDELLSGISESIVEALESDGGTLILKNPKDQALEIKFMHGTYEEEFGQMISLNGNGPLAWVLQEKRTFLMNSSETGHIRSLICAPLKQKEKLLGLMTLVNKRGGANYNQEDQILLESITHHLVALIENARLHEEAERTYFETIAALARAMEAKDHYTRGHLERVSTIVGRLARTMNIEDKDIQIMKDGALLHDIGKIGMSDAILLKPGKLTAGETATMRQHTIDGEKIIAPLSSLAELKNIVRGHQEWFDGSGYPDGLKGNDIPLGARILAVADVYDALTTDRPYRKAYPHEVAFEMIRKESGTHFDPNVVRHFERIWVDIRRLYQPV